MDKLDILFLDYPISDAKAEAVFRKNVDYVVFNLHEALRENYRENSVLGNEIRSCLENGELIPLAVFEQVLSIHLEQLRGKKILLTRFPRLNEQFGLLVKVLKALQIEIGTLWYVSHDLEVWGRKYFQNPQKQLWAQKFGDETLSVNKDKYTERKTFMLNLQQAQSNIPWHILEISDESEIEQKLAAILKIR